MFAPVFSLGLQMEQIQDALPQQEAGQTCQCAPLEAIEFQTFCEEIREQPNWRKEADRSADYYDGNQLDADTAAELEKRGMGNLVANMIKPTIDLVLGMEAKQRTDWRCIADDDMWQDAAEGLSAKLMEAERETRADRACSDAYAQQAKAGLGWVEVTKEQDPFKYPFRVANVHRREIFWDWSAKSPDLSDARYLVRQRWYPIEAAASYLPQHATLIRRAGMGWPQHWLQRDNESVDLIGAFENERRVSLADWEWRNLDRALVSLFEVWYRRWTRGLVIKMPDGRSVEFDPKNMVHIAGVARGVLKPEYAVYSKLRVSLWLGPHKLQDIDAGTGRIPYIPFFGYREDLTGVPYGLVRTMMSSQDEINARRRKLLWLLSSKVVEVDSDALDTKYNDFRDLVSEIARPDAVVVTNPNRKNVAGLRINDNTSVASQQFQVMEDAKRSLQETAGVYQAMLGDAKSGASSGIAVNSLIDQGSTTLAELTDNYRYSRRLVGEALVELIIDDLKGKEVQVVSGEGSRKKTIILNKPAVDPVTGVEYLENDISKAPVKVALEDVPTTPAYRAQMNMMISEVMKSSPPQAQAILMPYFIESTEMPKRVEIADQLRKAFGIGPDEQAPDPEKMQMQEMIAQLQEIITQGKQEYEGQISDLTHKLQQAQLAQANRAGELQIKQAELANKEADREASAVMEQRRLAIEEGIRAREAELKEIEQQLAMQDRQIKQAELEIRKQELAQNAAEAESAREERAMQQRIQHSLQIRQAELEAERAEQDRLDRESERAAAEERAKEEREEREKDRKQAVELAKVQAAEKKKSEDVAQSAKRAEVAPAPVAPAAPPITVNVQIDGSGDVKKSITFQKDETGKITGASIDQAKKK